MIERRLLDTNVVVRHLTRDPPALAAIADKLFTASDHRELTLVLLPAVLCECVFVLDSFYQFPRDRIQEHLAILITGAGLEIDDRLLYLDALECYRDTRLHFVDCVIAAIGRATGTTIASFDKGLQKLHGIKVDVDV